jgi:hypothetical protein
MWYTPIKPTLCIWYIPIKPSQYVVTLRFHVDVLESNRERYRRIALNDSIRVWHRGIALKDNNIVIEYGIEELH